MVAKIKAACDARRDGFFHQERQSVSQASALVHDPELLIIDEPMVGLDALAQRQTRELLSEEAARGKTIFLTTHTLSVAEAVCDRIAILNRGKVVATGPTAQLKAEAGQPGSPLEDVFLQLTYESTST